MRKKKSKEGREKVQAAEITKATAERKGPPFQEKRQGAKEKKTESER